MWCLNGEGKENGDIVVLVMVTVATPGSEGAYLGWRLQVVSSDVQGVAATVSVIQRSSTPLW